MDQDTRVREADVWAAVDGIATEDQLARLEANPAAHRSILDRLLDQAETAEEAARRLTGPERDQVLTDVLDELDRLWAAYEKLVPPPPEPAESPQPRQAQPQQPRTFSDPPGELRLHGSWVKGTIVVWAGGPEVAPADNDALADLLEAIGGPAQGWSLHAPVVLPGGVKADAVSIPIADALGWLVHVNGVNVTDGLDRIGSSVAWLARTALAGVRLAALGRVVPTLHSEKLPSGRLALRVQWAPALVEESQLARLSAAMPMPVAAITRNNPRAVATEVLGAVVDAIVTTAAKRLDLPAPPPVIRTPANVGEAVITRLDGSEFDAPVSAGAEVGRRLQWWAGPIASPNRPKLIVQLDPPDSSDAWFLQVLGPGAEGPLPVELSLTDSRATKPVADELARLERILPELLRPGGLRRGQVYLSQAEAWDLMTVRGASLEAAGFEVRVPSLSRRKPSPALRLFTGPAGDTVVGANQLSDVRWSVVFDDVELTAAEIARLAAEARPLIRSRGKWVELDKADLHEAAAALAERSKKTRLTGAEILRHAIGLEGTGLAGGVRVEGAGWATDLVQKAQAASTEPVVDIDGFVGTLRSYQSDAVAWLGFLDAVELGGCLALDMGLGKTPTVLAHMARTAGAGPALVVAPPAVVGNWAAEAARFTPGLRVVVHHGASRASAAQLEREVAGADLVITTYGTAVRDVDALSSFTWDRLVLDEAQAIKNAGNETSQQLRRLQARTRLALTGTPVENGLGDLWSILDFTNPGLVGSRSAFIGQLSGEGEAALRALNGILVFRRTKTEPEVAAELPDRIDELDHCTMTTEQIGLYQAVLDKLVTGRDEPGADGAGQGAILAAITALKQICNHPAAYQDDGRPLEGRSGKLARLEEIVDAVFAAGEAILIFTHFATWGQRLAEHLTARTGIPISCYHGGLARGARDKLVADFQNGEGPRALVLSLKAGGTGLNLTAANHVVLYDRWWNPAVEDQARDRAWRIGQTKTVISHRLVCPGTVDERVEEVVAGKRHIADVVLPKSSTLGDLNAEQLRVALGLRTDELLTEGAS